MEQCFIPGMRKIVDALDPTLSTKQPRPNIKLTHIPPLATQPHPPVPLWLYHLLNKRTIKTELYESMVDAMAAALLNHYFSLNGQFLVRPQHTYRILASISNQVKSDQWSLQVEGLSADRSLLMFSHSSAAIQLTNFSFNPASTSTPPGSSISLYDDISPSGSTSSFHDNLDVEIGEFDIPDTTIALWDMVEHPTLEELSIANGPSVLSDAVIDELGRLVIDKGHKSLRIPDLTVVHPLADFGSDSLIAIVENKFRSLTRAVAQLRGYAKDHFGNAPKMWSFAFALGPAGLMVAMFKFKSSTSSELVAISDDAETDGKTEAIWYPAIHDFVHRSLLRLLDDVCDNWELQWIEEDVEEA
ncbi:hypothetical protein BDP27DRAFT_1373760 [Rhodocollybia butyracea]|uniref:Uncharacterized protein n=1 Tax=Rhodocollybia butyracea TaxID=206335 RepID=A0A9P5P6Q4_9AGAR|nr:hypothetical protein BDP27DRAFT_1373760 [Rhodocollybia butyracea]